MRRHERRWAIVSKAGDLYNTGYRRADAIAYHIYWHVPANEATAHDHPESGGRLDEFQRVAWARCRKRGDRAVRVTITWPEHVR